MLKGAISNLLTTLKQINQPTLALFCITVRVIQGLLLNTAFNPDEVWQNQSIAYSLAFPSPYGEQSRDHNIKLPYGPDHNMFRTWEWQPYAQIRTFTHPFFTVIFYQIIIAFGLDSTWLVAWGPRIWHSVICGIADSFLIHLTATLINFLPQMYMELYISPPVPLSTSLDIINNIRNDDNNEVNRVNEEEPLESQTLLPHSPQRKPKSSLKDKNIQPTAQVDPQSVVLLSSNNNTPIVTNNSGEPVWFFRTSMTQFAQFFQSIPIITLTVWLFNWFSAYCYPRPFSNSLETALIIIGLSFWPFFYYQQSTTTTTHQQHQSHLTFAINLTISLCFAALSVMFRVTAVIMWAPLYLLGFIHLIAFNTGKTTNVIIKLFLMIIIPLIIGIIALLMIIEIDSYGYQHSSPLMGLQTCLSTIPTTTFLSHFTSCVIQNYPPHVLSLYNFYKINKAHNIASLYGENTPLFSIIVSIPVTTTILLPFLVLSVMHFISIMIHFWFKPTTNSPLHIFRISYLFYLAFFLPIFYCTNSHQEYRFILPAVPFLYLLASHSLAYFITFPPMRWSDIMEFTRLDYPTDVTTIRSKRRDVEGNIPTQRGLLFNLLWVLGLINLILTGLLFRLHQRGPYVLMDVLKQYSTPNSSQKSSNVRQLGILLPGCHQIPYPTFFHKTQETQFSFYQPDCSPLFSLEHISSNHSIPNSAISSIPCWLNQSDQFALLASSSESPLNGDCSSIQKPSFPGRNWISGHEQSKSHPLLFFLRHVVVSNLVEMSQSDEGKKANFHFDPNLFYSSAVSRYVKTLSDVANGVGGYSKHDDIVLLRILLDSFTPADNNDKQKQHHLTDLDKISLLTKLLQQRRTSQNNQLPTSSSQHLIQTDPFIRFSTHFNFPTTISINTPTHLQNLFFPDIVVLYTQEQEVLHTTLLQFGYTLQHTILHTLTEPDEKELFVYTQPGV